MDNPWFPRKTIYKWWFLHVSLSLAHGKYRKLSRVLHVNMLSVRMKRKREKLQTSRNYHHHMAPLVVAYHDHVFTYHVHL